MSTRLRFLGIVFGCLAAAACSHHKKIAPAAAPVASAKTMPTVPVPAPSSEFNTPSTPAPAPAAETALQDAYFDFDSYTLGSDARQNLSESAKWLEQHPDSMLLVEGHCDERGTEQYNLALGQRRAWEAKDYLSVLGIDAKLIKTISYGKDRPFDAGHDEEAWAKNRRAHLVITAQ